jgi:hypothetical protein
VALARPTPGLVIRYSYLSHSEHLQGRDEGQKDRPCAIIACIRNDDAGDTRVLVLPVTHSPPKRPGLAMEIPLRVKQRLGLDEARFWVVLSEWNEFVWPGPDLRPIPETPSGSVAYGMLPPGFFASVRDRFLALVQGQSAIRVPRT